VDALGTSMTTFEPFETGVEVQGQAVLSVVAGVPSAFESKAYDLLAAEGIEDPRPDAWYSQSSYLNAYRRIVDEIGENTLQRIAQSTPENAEWPSSVDGPVAALESIDDAYQQNHRGGDVGSYDVVDVDGRRATVRCRTPYPCAFDEELVEATVELFSDDYPTTTEIGATCRSDGGEECTYRVEW
jgi:hypothetical protein